MENKRVTRKSGIELLRIFAMLGVIVLHYNDGRAFVYANSEINRIVLWILESLCICAVDLFVLISGYFLSATQKRSLLKSVELIIQVIVFKVGIYIFTIFSSNTPFSIKKLILNMIPNNYFVVFYITLYIISPYLNNIFTAFTKAQWNKFIITMYITFSVYPTGVDLLEEILGREFMGLSNIGAWGAQQGFNVLNFILLYFVGAYLRYNPISKKIPIWKQLISVGITVLVIFVWFLFTTKLTRLELSSAWVYHNPVVILLSALLFILFNSFSFSNRIINELAKASLTCFLFHGMLLQYMKIEKYATGKVFVMIAHIIAVTIVCYLSSYVVYKIYNGMFKTLKRIMKLEQ